MILAMVLLGLNATNVSAFEVLTEDEVVRTVITEKDLVRAVDNFIILFDASGSMDAVYADTGKRRVVVAKEILQQRNKKLPELGWNAGLYLFTPSRPLYDMKRYNRREFGKAIDQLTTTTIVPPSRSQMMRDLDDLLSGLSGRTAVFLMTDGQFVAPIKSKTSPVMMAKELTAKYDVCAGILMVLEDIYIFEEDTITRVVAARADDILYSFDSADLRSEFHQELDAVGNFMRNNPDTRAIIAGYADSVGDPEYNMHLSRRRAESVAEYLTDNFNIDSDRLPVLWYGKTNPVADNATAAGRAKNRRTEIVIGRTR
jgi:OOP family OmpA-OmpF porin